MRMYDIILKKRDGFELSDQEIAFFIEGYTKGDIPDYQASALMMAIYYKGMNERETVTLTKCMAQSGDTVDLSQFGNLSVDKHSTGGVGDKTSLIVAPIVCAAGCFVTKMSGRGLGHTGGTVDKLESIKGYKTSIDTEKFFEQIKRVGMAVIGQSGNLTPADKKLYALRDVTATVDSIPLITSSIMSKKIAAGSKNIVLDVKVGSGAFMKSVEDAAALANEMVKIGKMCDRNIAAVLSDMNVPLGKAIGNSLEVIEAVKVLKGEQKDDLYEVCIELASQMISLAFDIDVVSAKQKAINILESGEAFAKFKEWITAQGGDIRLIENTALFGTAAHKLEIVAEKDGYITEMNAEKIGIAAVILGAGREKTDDTIDFNAGIIIEKKTGDRVLKGDLICTLYTEKEHTLISAQNCFNSAITIGNKKPNDIPVIYKIIR